MLEADVLMKKRIYLFLALLVSANVCYAELKIGFVNVPAVLEKAPQSAEAQKRLEEEFSPRQKQLIALEKEVETLKVKLGRDDSIMGEAEKRKLNKDIVAKQRTAKRDRQEFNEDVGVRRDEELDKLRRRISEAIGALAKDGKFDLLLTEGVIFASPQVDVTKQVQEKLAALSN